MKKILDFSNRSYSDVSGKYQNTEKPLKHQRRLGLVVEKHKKYHRQNFHFSGDLKLLSVHTTVIHSKFLTEFFLQRTLRTKKNYLILKGT